MVELSPDDAISLLRTDEQRMKTLENQRQQLLLAIQETEMTKRTLEELPENQKDSMIPIGAGIFLPAKTIKDTVTVNIGAGVIVEQNIEQALKTLGKREEKFKDDIAEITEQLEKITKRAQKLSAQLQAHMMQQRQGDVPVIG
ncbi:prefoldin subunit alpha [archaeon]|nr:prefoldin subunit alpha [archaeon]